MPPRLRFVAQRLVDLLFILVGVSILTFLMIRLVPGDAVQIMLGANVEITPERVEALRAKVGLDRPMAEQYVVWIADLLRGDFGTSLWTGRPVIEEIGAAAVVTVELSVIALLLAVVVAIPLGCLAAYARASWLDVVLRVVTVAGITIPPFWLGIVLLLIVFAVAPGLKTFGYVPFGQDPVTNLQVMALPVLSVALPVIANLVRIVRTAMLDSLGQDYIRTARAKGVGETRVVLVHALRTALIPVVTSIGILTGYLLAGSIVVEKVFTLPGLGRLVVGAIVERNYPLLQTSILLVTATFVAINFLVDLLYTVIDRRIAR